MNKKQEELLDELIQEMATAEDFYKIKDQLFNPHYALELCYESLKCNKSAT